MFNEAYPMRPIFVLGRVLAGFVCLVYAVESANTWPAIIRWLYVLYWMAMCVSYVIAPAKLFKKTAMRVVVIGNHILFAMSVVIVSRDAYWPNQTLSIGHLYFTTEVTYVIIIALFMACAVGAVSSFAEYVLCGRMGDEKESSIAGLRNKHATDSVVSKGP